MTKVQHGFAAESLQTLFILLFARDLVTLFYIKNVELVIRVPINNLFKRQAFGIISVCRKNYIFGTNKSKRIDF